MKAPKVLAVVESNFVIVYIQPQWSVTFSLDYEGVKTGFLVVLAAREEIKGKKAGDVQKEMLRLFARLGLLTEGKA